MYRVQMKNYRHPSPKSPILINKPMAIQKQNEQAIQEQIKKVNIKRPMKKVGSKQNFNRAKVNPKNDKENKRNFGNQQNLFAKNS